MKGHTGEDWDSFPRTKNQVDEKSLIRQFHSKQFVTGYYEDSQDFLSVLHRAWTASDVDQTPANQRPAIYYTRKFMKARWELKKKWNPHCFHGQSSNMVQTLFRTDDLIIFCGNYIYIIYEQHAMVYLKTLWEMHNEQRKAFFFNQMAYTHDSLTDIGLIDLELEEFMRTWLNDLAVRNNTFIVIASDHGNHLIQSKVHNTSLAARFDQLNPFMYLLLPPWVKQLYPERVKALAVNSKERVTTNLDLHWTIKHIMNFAETEMRGEGGQSLFTNISKDRTCSDMKITMLYCGCQQPLMLNKRYFQRWIAGQYKMP